MKNTRIQVISRALLEDCRMIRQKVFIDEQQVCPEEEWDQWDEESFHYLITVDQKPAGTARVRIANRSAKIERVAVLKEYRGQGLGRYLMEKILQEVISFDAIDSVVLGAQVQVIPFYEKLGFNVCGPEYLDAGIPGRPMERLKNQADTLFDCLE